VINATDDEVDIVELRMVASGLSAGSAVTWRRGSISRHAPSGDEVLGSADVGVASGDEPVEVGGFDMVVIEDEYVTDTEVGEREGACDPSHRADDGHAQAGEGGAAPFPRMAA